MAKYDDFTSEALLKAGLSPVESATRLRTDKNMPYTTAGLPGLLVREMPALEKTNATGFVFASPYVKDEMKNRGLQKNMFVQPSAGSDVIAHEAEHLLARQGLGFPSGINEKFDELVGDQGNMRNKFVRNVLAVSPYLKEKYGLTSPYLSSERMVKRNGGTMLYEQLAELAALEVDKGVDLTKDPELRKTLFKDRKVRETYNAITGLRQTRLDARDLPTYTRQPEKGSDSALNKLKELLGFAEGGYVEQAGNKKLI